jgi:hypothetical protein
MPFAAFSAPDLGVFVGNSLHWVVFRIPQKGARSMFIVAFNLSQEIFNEVPLPEIHYDIFEINVSLLGECLCMTVGYQTNKVDTADIWVMKEYGFRDSWCKLFTLDESCFGAPFLTLKPLAYSSNRSKVLLQVQTLKPLANSSNRSKVLLQKDRRKLFWFDLKSEKLTCVPGIPNFDEAMIYVGSLLPPSLPIDNYNYRKEKPQVEMQKKTQEKVLLVVYLNFCSIYVISHGVCILMLK